MGISRLTGTQKLILLFIYACFRARAPCWPRIQELARRCSCSRRSVFTALAGLEPKWIRIERRVGVGSSIYKPSARLLRVLEGEHRRT